MLDRCAAMLDSAGGVPLLDPDDRLFLRERLHVLRRTVEAAAASAAVLHGDVHLGNVLMAPAGPVWLDFEEVCVGPPGYDLAGLPEEVWPVFDAVDTGLATVCAELRSVCVAAWCSADPARDADMAEAAAYHLARAKACVGAEGTARGR